MKKILLYVLVLCISVFVIPAIFTFNTSKSVNIDVANNSNNEQQNQIPDEPKYDYKNYNTIKVQHTSTNTIEEIPLDEYLYGVVSAEMPASFNLEALKAQAVVARTYTIYKIIEGNGKHGEAHICDNSACCQAWISKEDRFSKWEEQDRETNWNKITTAVNSTQGIIVTYQGSPINAFFHSNSGGTTEAPVNVWGGTGYPYLQSVQTNGEERLYTI